LVAREGLFNANGSLAGNDFLVFYSAGRLAWSHMAGAVYDLPRLFAFQDSISGGASHLPFPYPPFFLFYIVPLAALAYVPALYVWIAATSVPFIFLVKKVSGAAIAAIALAPPLVQNAIDGQNGALTASLFAGGLIVLTKQRPILAGILFGLLSYKPQVFVLIPICLLAAREWRAFVSVLVTCCCLFLSSVMAFGLDIWWKYVELLPQQVTFILDGRLPVSRCPTLFMLVFYGTGNLAAANIAQAFASLAAWAFVGWSWRKAGTIFPRAMAFCVALPFSTPYILEYDLAVWVLPASILLMRLWRGEAAVPDWCALTLLWFLPPLIWLTSGAGLHLSSLALLPLVPYALWSLRREELNYAERRQS